MSLIKAFTCFYAYWSFSNGLSLGPLFVHGLYTMFGVIVRLFTDNVCRLFTDNRLPTFTSVFSHALSKIAITGS